MPRCRPASERRYEPRAPRGSVLHGVIAEHLETLLAQARDEAGACLPVYVERELRAIVSCGCAGRMEDRGITEVELREMLQGARGYHSDVVEGRFIVEATHSSRVWHVVVESDQVERLLVVVTAYPLEASR